MKSVAKVANGFQHVTELVDGSGTRLGFLENGPLRKGKSKKRNALPLSEWDPHVFDKDAVEPAVGDIWRDLYVLDEKAVVAWSPVSNPAERQCTSRFPRVLFAAKGWEPTSGVASTTGSAAARPSATPALADGAAASATVPLPKAPATAMSSQPK